MNLFFEGRGFVASCIIFEGTNYLFNLEELETNESQFCLSV
jgi:hypothetical protein